MYRTVTPKYHTSWSSGSMYRKSVLIRRCAVVWKWLADTNCHRICSDYETAAAYIGKRHCNLVQFKCCILVQRTECSLESIFCVVAAPTAKGLRQGCGSGDGGVGPPVPPCRRRPVRSSQRHRHHPGLVRLLSVGAPYLQHTGLPGTPRDASDFCINHAARFDHCSAPPPIALPQYLQGGPRTVRISQSPHAMKAGSCLADQQNGQQHE